MDKDSKNNGKRKTENGKVSFEKTMIYATIHPQSPKNIALESSISIYFITFVADIGVLKEFKIQNSKFKIQNYFPILHSAFLLAEIIPIEPKRVMPERESVIYIQPLFKLLFNSKPN